MKVLPEKKKRKIKGFAECKKRCHYRITSLQKENQELLLKEYRVTNTLSDAGSFHFLVLQQSLGNLLSVKAN